MTFSGLRWGDGVIATLASGVVVAAFALAYLPDSEASMLVITQTGEPPRQEPLDRTREIEIQGPAGITRVQIEPGRARCADSPGTRNICENSGWLQRHGEIAVSLPNRLTLQVQGRGPGYDSLHY
ncbi:MULTISPECIES: NusG domain II-containing protein [unclassified Thioalkalivibrio]|uniref:NusG domain II-containing protein n=1 Tax=unclassified Thioalkalivibrio TaxID=2621013 RepID=UPI0003601616|nr:MULTISPECIES: NusG domain II-containing protein [unclassified Thioalkalivibrio]